MSSLLAASRTVPAAAASSEFAAEPHSPHSLTLLCSRLLSLLCTQWPDDGARARPSSSPLSCCCASGASSARLSWRARGTIVYGDGLVSVLIGEKCEWVCCTRAVRVSVHSGHIVRICPVSLSGVVENRKTEKPNTAPHAGRERAMSQSVNATLEALVSTYLKPWSTAGVSLAAIDHAHHNFADYRDRSWGAYVPPGQSNNRLLRINILSNTLYYYTCAGSKSTRRLARQEAVLRLLRFTLDRYRLPDIDLVLSVSDRPTVPKALVARSGGINGAMRRRPSLRMRSRPSITRCHFRRSALIRCAGRLCTREWALIHRSRREGRRRSGAAAAILCAT